MKKFNIIFSILALIFILVNSTKLNFNNLLSEESSIALIGIVASIIVLVLLQILKQSKAIEKKMK